MTELGVNGAGVEEAAIGGAISCTGPLAGIRSHDFGHLADRGANVAKVKPPGGPRLPNTLHRFLDRNKTLLTLDLETAEGKSGALPLVRATGVAVENFRLGRSGPLPHRRTGEIAWEIYESGDHRSAAGAGVGVVEREWIKP